LFSSHILTDVERIADRVGILHDGAMLVDATLDDLKQRVVRVDWTPDGERGDEALTRLDADPRVLRVGRRREGVDLTLLDADATWLAALRAAGRLGTPVVPSLEDLFLDLTGPRQPGALADVAQLLASRGDES
jgi:ABC-type multidrug transport system ATPase subunit